MKTKIFLYITILFLFSITSCNSIKKNYNSNLRKDISDSSKDSGYFIDKRDGKKYKWVKIGDQIWMAENLAYKVDSGCVAYKNNQKHVDKYGFLYNAKTAQQSCPNGWHLPSKEEYIRLCKYFGDNIHEVFDAFKNGNDYGFNSKNAGSYDNLKFRRYWCFQKFRIDEFWTSTISYSDSNGVNYYNYVTINYFRKIALVGESGKNENNYYIPIRCIKD